MMKTKGRQLFGQPASSDTGWKDGLISRCFRFHFSIQVVTTLQHYNPHLMNYRLSIMVMMMMKAFNLFEDGGLAGAGGSCENEPSLSVQTASYCRNLSDDCGDDGILL